MFKGINLGSLTLIFLIVALLFGTKRLKELGNDLGIAIKNFRKSLRDDQDKDSEKEA
ncbi:MAG TPA: twin-arginine translocase TatA/TatE family subunit [Gammaproteobacteria bacterium]|nr:twin-arginine translocase TatA/TatE family subunit [Gammaproteobacteria bacterium]